MCKACKDGVFGDNCSTKCPAMYFGPGCLLQCNCITEQCHHVIGCLQSSSKGAWWTLLTVPLAICEYILRMFMSCMKFYTTYHKNIMNINENNIDKAMHVPCNTLNFKTILAV